MPRLFVADDFASVADLVRLALGKIDPATWDDCEAARARTAVSRAYYAVFLQLKGKLLGARTWTEFPRKDVHRKLTDALTAALGGSHKLVLLYRPLLNKRKLADYDAGREILPVTAESMATSAWTALDEIDALSPAEIRRIADNLYDIDREIT